MKKILTALAPFILRRFRKKRYWFLALAAGSTAWAYVQNFTPDQLWKEPRDLLVDRIEVARDVQQETAEEFKSALEQFKDVTSFEGGALEEKHARGLPRRVAPPSQALPSPAGSDDPRDCHRPE